MAHQAWMYVIGIYFLFPRLVSSLAMVKASFFSIPFVGLHPSVKRGDAKSFWMVIVATITPAVILSLVGGGTPSMAYSVVALVFTGIVLGIYNYQIFGGIIVGLSGRAIGVLDTVISVIAVGLWLCFAATAYFTIMLMSVSTFHGLFPLIVFDAALFGASAVVLRLLAKIRHSDA